ncbi:late competence development ComFB family protein [Motilimonas sp. 1_MG-2023]|uniref:late competence development ComFB family protein n=1 Tax=Motilimonas TaxID=1914248 RepID=UPI0026E30F5D|nr:late competence development ComFB family protein [Motilimonas sp. 1_MG-2023]MDO6526384.1 late competence development ComFB family protein [Motilimonas sp. 1_MG-2023]
MALGIDVHNFTERFVSERFKQLDLYSRFDSEFLEDLACIVLNKLPVHYIRYDVDMYNYMKDEDKTSLKQKVEAAVDESIAFLFDEKQIKFSREPKDTE